MVLSPAGGIVAEEWQKTPDIRPNVMLDEWVIMPNHLHGILVIMTATRIVETPRRGVSTAGLPQQGVSTRRAWPPGQAIPTAVPARLQPGSLGAIIGQIKSVCTKRIWAAGYTDFGWQARFHDHIIRTRESLRRIRRYIADNPARWADDHYHVP